MTARLLDSPLTLILILLVVLLLFGAPKLPGMARSLGQSMRIFKSEVKEMKRDGQDENVTVNGRPVADGETVATTPAADAAPGTDHGTRRDTTTPHNVSDTTHRPGV